MIPEPGGQTPDFRSRLVASGLVYTTPVMGVYGYSGRYERIIEGLSACIHHLARGQYEEVQLPPVLDRSTFDRTGYLESFPNLMGSVHIYRGDDQDHDHADLIKRYKHNGSWQELLSPAEVVLTSAACHAVYPMCTGQLPMEGRRFDVRGHCFRHEPCVNPTRMQSFRLHELVYVGCPEHALEHRDSMLSAGVELLQSLGLELSVVEANDPFFGRLGQIFADQQLEGKLKIEGVMSIGSDDPTPLMSANYAEDHFGHAFSIRTPDGGTAHSSCIGFGLDRIALALLYVHGLDLKRWPSQVTHTLWP